MVNIIIIGLLQFFLLTFIAMLLYPGGTWENSETTHYIFTENAFSDLGLTRTWSDKTNYPSCLLFVIALFLTGSTLILISLVIMKLMNENIHLHRVSTAGIGFGIITGIAFAGIGFTPENLLLRAHIIFVIIAFTGIVPMNIIYAYIFYKDNRLPKIYPNFLVVESISSIGYLFVLIVDFGIPASFVLVFYIVAQKLIVYVSIIAYLALFYGIKKNIAKFSSTITGLE